MSNRIAEALKHADGSHTLADIKAGVQSGVYQQWINDDAVIITEIVQVPQYKVLRFFLAGGKMEAVKELALGILFWAKRQGCVKAELTGRFGWERSFAKDLGAKPVAMMMEMRL